MIFAFFYAFFVFFTHFSFFLLRFSSLFSSSPKGQGQTTAKFTAKKGEFHSDPVCTDPVQNFPVISEVSKRGWRTEGVGARKSLPHHKFKPFPSSFSYLPLFQGAAKGGRQKEFDHFFRFGQSFGHFLVTFLMLLSHFPSLFCQTPFAGLLLRQGDF